MLMEYAVLDVLAKVLWEFAQGFATILLFIIGGSWGIRESNPYLIPILIIHSVTPY